MRILKLAIGVALGVLAGGGAEYWFAHQGQQRALFDESDNAASLNRAVEAYETWCTAKLALPRLPATESPEFLRAYIEREHKRFSALSAAIERCLIPSSGSGGSNVRYLHKLSQAQEQATARWLEADAAGQSAALADLYRQIDVNYGSLENAIELFKIFLGREDHGVKGLHVFYRK